MASTDDSSSNTKRLTENKPVVVRVKRKSSQSPLDAFWLEINERPSKRPLLDFEKLSLSDDSVHGKVGELKTKKVFVHHIETVSNSDATIDILQSFVAGSADAVQRIEVQRQSFKKDKKQVQLLSKSRQSQQILAQNARFEQIWRSRRGNKEASHNRELHDMCHFYDVVRVDDGNSSSERQEQEHISLEDQKLLSSYLPLLREFIPSAATTIESDIRDSMPNSGDYVYDYYTVMDDMDISEGSLNPFPSIQVEDEDFYDGPDDESEYETDDSNAEHHPRNEYPDEESEVDYEEETEASSIESEEGDETDSISANFEEQDSDAAEEAFPSVGDGTYDDYDDDNYDDEYSDDNNVEDCG